MKRYTEDEKRTIINKLSAIELSRAAFRRSCSLWCARVGAWAKTRTDSLPRDGFVEVEFPAQSSFAGIEVWVWDSICVRFSAVTQDSVFADFWQRFEGC
jgi:hypothetical protein